MYWREVVIDLSVVSGGREERTHPEAVMNVGEGEHFLTCRDFADLIIGVKANTM